MFPPIQKKILFSLAFYTTEMKQPVAQLLLMLTVLSLASCSIEKRVYTKGYHISWLHTVGIDASQGCSKGASQVLPKDLSSNLSQNLETDISQDLSSNLSQTLETAVSQDLPKDLSTKKTSPNIAAVNDFKTIQTKQDTVIPSVNEDYVGSPSNSNTNTKPPFLSAPIRRPKTIESLKVSIGRDFKLALLSILTMGISLGFLYLISLVSTSGDGRGIIFFGLTFLASIFTFIFDLTRAIIRTFKLSALKVVGKSDETEINRNSNSQPIRESEGQYFRRFLLAMGRFFRFLLRPSSFGAKVLLYLMALIVGALIIGLSQ
jgi:hypothetical protein